MEECIMITGFIKPKFYGAEISVGALGSDIIGYDSASIQKGVEIVRSLGGGIVRLSPGKFESISTIRLYNNIHLIGSGDSTVLKKGSGHKTRIVEDADYGELKAVVADSSGFKVGMGIQLYDNKYRHGWDVSTAVITAIEGTTLYFDQYLIHDYSVEREGIISNAYSIIAGVEVENVRISNLIIDGNKDESADAINGCRGGGIYLHVAKNCCISNVKVMDFHGDGLSWQLTEDITVKGCEVFNCTNFGAHPGTGSARSIIEDCSFYNNASDGLFVCWRVQDGLFKNNRMYDNGGSGINIGHKDIRNLFESNHIYNNDFSGIRMRNENILNAAHDNKYCMNIIEDNGVGETGAGVYIDAPIKGVTIERNIIRDTGEGKQRYGVVIRKNVENLIIEQNEMNGHQGEDIFKSL
jgi:hypothetical protein